MQATIDRCLEGGNPFAAWRMPKGEDARLLFQKGADALPFDLQDGLPLEAGYIVLPFYPGEEGTAYMIQPDRILETDAPDRIPESELQPIKAEEGLEPALDRQEYLEKLESLIERIRTRTDLEKVVLSRVSDAFRGTESPGMLFDRLCQAYPDAYVHIFRIPGKGTWLGATPETLIEMGPSTGMIQALAGTRPKGGEREWGEKEFQEQALVAQHIEDVLKKCELPILKKDGPSTVGAGRVEHLSTEFRFPAEKAAETIASILSLLHPTPAVCGVPRDHALESIRELEEHRRGFYAGAVGPWNLKGEKALFVNLRCFRVLEDRYQLYVGGGINAGSVPEDEWDETEWKASTIRSLLEGNMSSTKNSDL